MSAHAVQRQGRAARWQRHPSLPGPFPPAVGVGGLTEWRLHVPHRSRDDHLISVASQARVLDSDDGAVAREVAIRAQIDLGLTSADQLLDYLDRADAGERRRLLDQAREAAGLPLIDEVEAKERFEGAQQAARLRGGQTSPYLCHAEGCGNYPVDGFGAHAPVSIRRWYCEKHRDQARPEDLKPLGPHLVIKPFSGAIVEIDEAEELREAQAAESRQARREARLAEATAAAEERAEHEAAWLEQVRRQTPPGIWPNLAADASDRGSEEAG
jgi:hypothetical protein